MKVMKKAKERDLWQSIDYRFMTEGEDDKGEFVLRHPLPWRSKNKSWCIINFKAQWSGSTRPFTKFKLLSVFQLYCQNLVKLHV